MTYYRPIAHTDLRRPAQAVRLAGGPVWFSQVEVMSRNTPGSVVPVADVPAEALERLCSPRADICGLSMDRPRLMGVLNVTPDSFSDGGLYNGPKAAVIRAKLMVHNGADILDIGGESTRPGASLIEVAAEVRRTEPIIKSLISEKIGAPISIDTRKADVAGRALDAGAVMFNDVTALSYDPDSLSLAGSRKPFVCLMHASGDPKTMQDNPSYENVALDVYDYLLQRVEAAVNAGVPRNRIVVDPGIGFGKTLAHNLLLLRNLSLFHGLGCPVLLGASRKRFIGEITDTPDAAERGVGSVAVALNALGQGIQIIRAHDITAHKQAFAIWQAMMETKDV